MRTLLLIIVALFLSLPAQALCLVNCDSGETGLVDGAFERMTKEGDKSANQSTAKFKPWGVGLVVHTISSGAQNSVNKAGTDNNSFFLEHYFSPFFSIGGTYITADFDSLDDMETGETITDEYKHSHIIGYLGGRMWISTKFQVFMQVGVSSTDIKLGGDKWTGMGQLTAVGLKYQSSSNAPAFGIQQTTITGKSNDSRMNIGFNSIGLTFEVGM